MFSFFREHKKNRHCKEVFSNANYATVFAWISSLFIKLLWKKNPPSSLGSLTAKKKQTKPRWSFPIIIIILSKISECPHYNYLILICYNCLGISEDIFVLRQKLRCLFFLFDHLQRIHVTMLMKRKTRFDLRKQFISGMTRMWEG